MSIETLVKAATKHVFVIDAGSPRTVRSPKNAVAARIGDEIQFDMDVLEKLSKEGWQPVHYDLLVLCAAVEFADRRWERPNVWSRSLKLTLPVIALQLWQRAPVHDALQDVLRHLTGDNWDIHFVPAASQTTLRWRQIPIAMPRKEKFVIAYSEGLDSRAVSALSGGLHQALCVRVANTHQRRENGDMCFMQLPFKVDNRICKESSFRTRGFQFACVTAIAAHITKLDRIIVPESGQGAFGTVLLPLHRQYADYRNHPTFFRKMERLLRELINHSVTYEQPRLWLTKGETLTDFLKLEGKSKLDLISTRSCWQKRGPVNHGGKRKQCGICAACLLRRFSLATAGVDEPENTYLVERLQAQTIKEAFSNISSDRHDVMVQYTLAGVRHWQKLADLGKNSESTLGDHVWEIADSLAIERDDAERNLRQLLSTHTREWQAFMVKQGKQSFLHQFIDGGIDD